MTAWINLLLFSLIDQPKDVKDKHHSITTTFGLTVTRNILLLLFIAFMVLTVIQLTVFSLDEIAILTLMLMVVLLLIIFMKKDYFEKDDRYRLLGDAVFLLPVIYNLF